MKPFEIMNSTEAATCENCSIEFQRAPLFGEHRQTWCDRCADDEHSRLESAAIARKHEDAIERALTAFGDICPVRFFESDPNHEGFRKPLLAKVEQWKPTDEKPWLGIVGKKGSCKTRIAVMRTCQQIRHDRTCRPLFMAAYDFAEAVQSRFDDDSGESRRLIQDCRNSGWLILDDIGKARATPAVVAALFALLDHRHGHNLVTIWTSNSTPEEFCDGMPADTAGPMVRRLKETSMLIAVS